MTETPPQNIKPSNAFHSAATVLFVLGLLSIGNSNIISAVTLRTMEYVNIIAILLIIIYFATAYFTRQGSHIAFLIGAGAFALSSIQGFIVSIMNVELMNSTLGEGSFIWVMGLNLVYVLFVGSILLQQYKALPRA